MELHLILGPSGSGKSLYAESLAAESGKNLVYLATMVPQNEENLRRIEKHRIQRRDKGFRTVECGWQIDEIAVSPGDTVLLEDVSNLLANGIFAHGSSMEEALRQIETLAKKCRRLIAVSIEGLLETGYDGETAAYIRGLNALNQAPAAHAASVTRMENGHPCKIQ